MLLYNCKREREFPSRKGEKKMKFMEKLIVKTNEKMFANARENNTLNEMIRLVLEEDKEGRTEFLLRYNIVTKEEINNALKEM